MTVGSEYGASSSPSPLGDRYTIVRALGRGGFGQTYLAKDRHRQDELCVVKEFVPQVEGPELLAKAKELFEREAKTLYELDHPQIPKFRQMITGDTDAGGGLYLVQDFVPGFTYQAMLADRQEHGGSFSETEITQLLYQLLPVLTYIHRLGIVHRDISPDNLILRPVDGLPVLIDFGSVKAIAAAIRNQLPPSASEADADPTVTRIGKIGYVPQEQMSQGEADPSSDLYSLAATMLVLSTGETPEMLNDPEHGVWRGYETLSPKLGQILRKMLSPSAPDRFQSAEAVLDALQGSEMPLNTIDSDLEGPEFYAQAGLGAAGGAVAAGMSGMTGTADFEDGQVMSITSPEIMPAGSLPAESLRGVDSAANEAETYEPEVHTPAQRTGQSDERQALIGLLVVLGVVGTALLFWFTQIRRPSVDRLQRADTSSQPQARLLSDGDFSDEEIARKQEIDSRREGQGISSAFFTRLIDQLFYQEYPKLLTSGPNGGRKSLSAAAEDEPLRIRWDHIALGLLDTTSDSFSDRALSNLGNYSEESRSEWRSLIAGSNVGDRALIDLTDAKFFSLFPQQAGRDFLTQPIGQLYYALASDRARAIETGSVTENIQFAANAFSQTVTGQLGPGEGRIYTMSLSTGQLLRLNLSAPAESTQVSLYPPEPTDDRPAVFADSEQTTWSGAITQNGVYEGVVINRSSEVIDYELTVAVDRVTDAPVAPPRQEDSTDSESSADDTDDAESSDETNQPSNSADDSGSTTDESSDEP